MMPSRRRDVGGERRESDASKGESCAEFSKLESETSER